MGERRLLVGNFDDVEWESRSDEQLATQLAGESLWLRFSNFYRRNLSLLGLLPPGQLVLWKLEHWGADTPFDRVPKSADVDINVYVDELSDLGHSVCVYAFNERNRALLLEEAPSLREMRFEVLPIAQKPPSAKAFGVDMRGRLGVGTGETLLGVGGLLHPAKGIDEIAVWFLRSMQDTKVHLLCSVMPHGQDETEAAVRKRWEKLAGVETSEKLHIHVGDYGQWSWMCSFYEAIDVMLVNSISDSWGRMASEAIGAGVPTIIRRADCGTNYIAPDILTVNSFSVLSEGEFRDMVEEARSRAPRLAEYVRSNYALPVLRRRFVNVLRTHTPRPLLAEFDRLARRQNSREVLDTLMCY